MSIYDDPKYFELLKINLKAENLNMTLPKNLQEVMDVSELKTQFEFLTDVNNFKYLGFLAADGEDIDNGITVNTKFSLSKFVNGFKGFGHADEAQIIFYFLKGISVAQDGDFVFTPASLSEYIEKVQQEKNSNAPYYQQLLIKGLSDDATAKGAKVTKQKISEASTDFNLAFSERDTNVFVDKISAKENSDHFTYAQFQTALKESEGHVKLGEKLATVEEKEIIASFKAMEPSNAPIPAKNHQQAANEDPRSKLLIAS